MAKILSQEEIDALLTTVASSEPEAGHEQPVARAAGSHGLAVYDFKHPNRVSKDQIRKLENIHDNLSGHLGSMLSTIQRAMVDVDLVSVDQITYTEYIGSLKSPSCSYTFRLPPLEGVCVIDISPVLAFAMVDRLFGGRGAALETERELTGIERNVMRKIVGRMFEQLELSWERVMELKAEPVGFETNPQFIQIVPPGETVIVVSLQVNMPSAGGVISLCYPYVTLEAVLDQLSTQHWVGKAPGESVSGERKQIRTALRRLEVPLDAQLAQTEISLRDLLALEPGVVIPLPLRVGEAVSVRVAGRPKFTGTIGKLGRHCAVRIEAPILNEGE